MTSDVLVVEDEPIIRMDAVALLEAAGLHVVEFDCGLKAANYLEAHKDDVAAIFTDVNLRGEFDGLKLAKLAALTMPSIVLIVTSGGLPKRPPDLPREVKFMPKPWLPLDVLTALQHAVSAHESASLRRSQ